MYSAMLNLEDSRVTIIGGGKVAYRKACLLVQEGCEIQVIAPAFIEAFKDLGQRINKVYKNYEEGDCVESNLVFAVTDDRLLNEAVGLYCKRARILCNVVDHVALSSFSTPAQFKRGDLIISISTGGNSPFLASKIKEDLANRYDETYEVYVQLLGQLREKVLQNEVDETKKKEILNHMVTLNFEELKSYAKYICNRYASISS